MVLLGRIPRAGAAYLRQDQLAETLILPSLPTVLAANWTFTVSFTPLLALKISTDVAARVMAHGSCAHSSTDFWTDELDFDNNWQQNGIMCSDAKMEPMDDDFMMDDIQPAPDAEAPTKRPRGRPRKHPVATPTTPKVTKGRSKTGCITCRKRKKKCDEAKPRCKLRPAHVRISNHR